jgi:hypothetical protein
MGISKRLATRCIMTGSDRDSYMINGKTRVNSKLFGIEEEPCTKEKSTRKRSCKSSDAKDATSLKREKTSLFTEVTQEPT